ncbi:hypothetical protein GF312_18915, partial [Candidatus Poribacteria bacterium]|nr:hypothetical protein [Candidatus Poribacteria bacterium]
MIHQKNSQYKKRLFIKLFLCLILTILVTSNTHSAPPLWTETTQISLGKYLSTEVDVCSRGEEIHVVWSDDRTGNREIFYRFSQDSGRSWSKEEKLTNTQNHSLSPAIACDANILYLVWRERTDDGSIIYFRTWNGISWSSDLLLSADQTDCRKPEITSTTMFPGNYIYVVWENHGDNGVKSYITRSSDTGKSFSYPEPITSLDWDTKDPYIWGGVRDAYVVWTDNREGDLHIFFKKWGEVQNTADVRLSQVPNCRFPSISGSEPNISAVWQCVEKDTVYADIHFSQSSDYAFNWEQSFPITRGEAESIYPKVIIYDETVWIFWQDGRNGEWQILSQQIDQDNPQIYELTDPRNQSISTDVSITPGQIHVFWTQVESDSMSKILYTRRDEVPPQRPNNPEHFDLTSNIGYDDDDKVTFIWELSTSSYKVSYNVYVRVDNEDFILADNTFANSYDIQGENGRAYQIYIEAVDEVGNTSQPSGLSPKIMCDNHDPQIIIHSPQPGSTIRGDTSIILSVQDENFLSYSLEYGMGAVPSDWLPLAGPFIEEAERHQIMTWRTSALDGIYTLK